MSENPIELYLDLMKEVLSFSLWEEQGVPLKLYSYKKPFVKRLLLNTLSWALKQANLQALKIKKHDAMKKNEGMIWPSQAHTMIGRKRLDNIQFCVENVIKDDIRGDCDNFSQKGDGKGQQNPNCQGVPFDYQRNRPLTVFHGAHKRPEKVTAFFIFYYLPAGDTA